MKKEIPPAMEIWKAFDIIVWIYICFAFIFIIIADKVLSKNKNHYSKSIYNIFWVYFKPLIGIGEHLRYYSFFYILWLISVRPLTEIFRNDLCANLIAVPNRDIDNLDDLLVDNLNVYTDGAKLHYWRQDDYKKFLQNNDNLKKFSQLVEKTKPLDSLIENGVWKQLLDDPHLMINLVKNSAVVEDDQSVEYFKTFLKRFISLYSGKESYIPKLITPLCYGPQFQFVKEVEKV